MDQPTWIGRTLGGRYKIDALLGQGGMSGVYKATDPNLKRVVAIKLIHSHLSTDPSFVQRFEIEAAAVASLRHPNIVQVYDFNNDNGTYYMVLEFIPGETLQDRLKRLVENNRKLSLEDALKFTVNIADAVGYAHQRGMVHRDIKPANIMLDMYGQAILMDFGIVKILGGDSHTSTGAVVGTARYMSPESIRSEVADHRSDIYSLGVAMYEMLSGRTPFVADSAMTLMMMHLNDPVPDVRDFRPDINPEIVSILEKCLSKNRDDRFQSAQELSDALRRVLSILATQTTTVSVSPVQSAPKSEAKATTVAEGPRTGMQGKPAVQDPARPKSESPRPAKKKSNTLIPVLGIGAMAILVTFAVLGVNALRSLSKQLEATPAKEVIQQKTITPPAMLASTDNPLVEVTTSPTIESVATVPHLMIPAETFEDGVILTDTSSLETGAEQWTSEGDTYKTNLLERPFTQDMSYLPDLDIQSFNLQKDNDWYYVSIALAGTDPDKPQGIHYAVEMDTNLDGFGDYLIWAELPLGKDWSTQSVQVYSDQNRDSAGKSPLASDAPFTGDGYETLLFDGTQSFGNDPDLAWARLIDSHIVQFAFKRSWAGEKFMYGVLADGGLMDVSQFEYTDRFKESEAGSPVKDSSFYPLNTLFAIDTTCRGAVGLTPAGYGPRVCSQLVPVVDTNPTRVTGCQPPPGGCGTGFYWWGEPHCACSITPP